jgi:hypothetical protein
MHLKAHHIALLVAMTAAAACNPDITIDPSDRPEPPPAAAFDADLSFFEDRTPAEGGTTTGWAEALATVAAARSEMAVLEVPEALLRAATAGEGTRAGQAWRWPFSTSVGGDRYEGELRGTVVGSTQYEWNLFVSAPDRSPQLTDYLWAQAYAAPAGHQGIWSLADAEAATDTIIARVSWLRATDNSISFAFSASDSAGWKYERSAAGNVLTYIVFSAPRYRVVWVPATGVGSSWTSTTSTSCWDENVHDVGC